jgi:hypothetical protein
MFDIRQYKDRLNNPILAIYLILALLPIFSITVGNNILAVLYAISGGLCVYLAYKRRDIKLNIIPILMLLCMAVFYYTPDKVGNVYWPVAFGLGLFFTALWSARFIDYEVAFVLGIFFVSTFIHVVPALITDMIEEIDPYYDYKWGDLITLDGVIPVHDWKTYPLLGGLDRSLMPFGNSVAMAMYGRIFTLVGMGYHQSAILLSGLMGGLAAVAAYFLIKELLYNRQNAKLAAMFGVLVLILSVAWSTKTHATDSENDSFGGFIMLFTLYIYMYALNRGNFMLAVVGGGMMFGWFTTLWDGYRLFVMFVCFAIAMMAFVGIFQKKSSLKYLTYFVGMWIVGNILWRLILHQPGEIFGLVAPRGIEVASLALAIFAGGLNEYFINYRRKISKKTELVVVGVMVCILILVWPYAWYHFYKVGFIDVGQASVVFKTIAEQAPFADSVGAYFTNLISMMGVAAIYSLFAIPILIYLIYREFDFGSAIMLSWLGPLAWGLYFKAQYSFIASIPFALASSWIVLYVMTSKNDESGLKILPTIMVVFGVLFYTPLNAYIFSYDSSYIFYNVATYDRMGWEGALQYFKTLPENTAIVTWWDYGHWITAVSKRYVLIDNLQRDHWEIQDVARFFMRAETEEEAFKIIEKYQAAYHSEPFTSHLGNVELSEVAIDWTMIGKSGAMRFIATGNLTDQSDGEYDSYAQCGFAPQYSNVNGSLIAGDGGQFLMAKTLIYACSYNKDGLGGLEFKITDKSMSVMAISQDGQRVPWSTWMNSYDASLFGVKSPNDILGVCIKYPDRLNNIPPSYTNFVYSSKRFNNFMLARLYFGENIGAFKAAGLSKVNWTQLKHFTKDKSFEEGFVETWKISYGANSTEVKQ